MLEEKILSDYREAMKNKDTLKTSVLSFLRADLINLAVSKKKDKLDDSDVVLSVKKQIKAHQESIEQFTKGARLDLADKEAKELEILNVYLPPQMAAPQIKKIIEEIITAIGAQSIKDMGRVMKEAALKIGPAADARLVSDLVKERLSRILH
ncbi:MAG: GatB/YqeY domain-containing protein [Candidatus Omnitrophota bacterium]